MGKKQSVKKLAREKKKADTRSRQQEMARDSGDEPQLSDRGILRNILKKVGHGGKQIDAIISSMNDSDVRAAIDNWKLKNELDDL